METLELSNAEKIMQACKTDKEKLSAISDCFAIIRIEKNIMALSKTAAFNQKPREQMAEKFNELDKILLKYKIKNGTNNFLLRRSISIKDGNMTFDIETENLSYCDASFTHHGLQCNHVGGTETHEKIMDLCKQMVGIARKIDLLNNLSTSNYFPAQNNNEGYSFEEGVSN